MKNRRRHPRISIEHEINLHLYDLQTHSRLTGGLPALLADLSVQGAGLKFSQVLIDGRHLFYSALDSNTVGILLIFPPRENDSEEVEIAVRPIWFDRDMEDQITPFRMGVQFVEEAPASLLSR